MISARDAMACTQGVIIDFSQEGIVGATNVHALVVSMMALVSLLGLVTKGVTYVAILAPGFKYQQNLFVVKASAVRHFKGKFQSDCCVYTCCIWW